MKRYLGEHGPRKNNLVLKETYKILPVYIVEEVHLTFRMLINETRVATIIFLTFRATAVYSSQSVTIS